MPVLPGAFSPVHLAVIAVVALLVLGPDKLPDLARKASRLHREYKNILDTLDANVHGFVNDVVPEDLTSAIPSSLQPPQAPTSRPTGRAARTWLPEDR